MFRNLFLSAALAVAAAPAMAERIDIDLAAITDDIVPTRVLAGDREFGGNGPHMVVDGRLLVTRGGTALVAEITFRAEETGGDGSFTRITRNFEVWRSERGERIDYVLGGGVDRAEWVSSPGCSFGCGFVGPHEDGALIVTRRFDGPLFSEITYLGDTAGDDISTDDNPHGDTSIREIRFRPITVETIE
ncbi:hypothetical protein HKCCE2091_17585 [Rhodobacterales bacterium HKCCE2091]|nr:hypothetical protein [Rhodobacterales bacterium HKCCE2091]